MPDHTHDTLLRTLRDRIRAVGELQAEIQRLHVQMSHLQRGVEARKGALAAAVGARDAIAELVLPEGMTVAEAWENDFGGIKSMTTDSGRDDDRDDTDGEPPGEEPQATVPGSD